VSDLGLRERKKEKTREALVRSALDQFAKRGFEGVTVEDIVAACDVSPRTFFRYFASKEDVLFADGDEQRERVVEVLRSQRRDMRPLEALQAGVLEVVGKYETQRDVIALRHRIMADTPSLRGRLADRNHGWESAVVAELRESGRADGVAELTLRLTVAAAISALRVVTESWVEDPTQGELPVLIRTVFDQLRNGLDL
jgi:AcrR family transcriptional regulator